jgi:hypothetical protein
VGVAKEFGAAAAALMLLGVAATEAFADGADDRTVLLFAGTDIWRDGAFLYGGELWSPAGLDHEGFTGTM